jgi:hypothetical protein
LKQKPEEQYNPFDNIFFWLQLASIDFTFGLEENMNAELDTSLSKNQSPERKES